MTGRSSLPEAIDVAIATGTAARTRSMSVPSSEASGLTVAEDLLAPAPLPSFDGSAMDGYAVRAQDTPSATTAAPVVLHLVDEAQAGHPARRVVAAGEATRISTGARVPAGADAVVRLEDAEETGEKLVLRHPVPPGHDIRRAGEDYDRGDLVVPQGTRLHAGGVAALAGLGIDAVHVRRPPTVSVLVTGDEVVRAGHPSVDGGVRDVHGVALPALLRAAGTGAVHVSYVGDDPGATVGALRDADGDLLVTCGGMSVGLHDHVRRAGATLGVRELVGGIRMRPGAPTAIGVLPGPGGPRPVLGLPGTPAAALAATILFGRPLVRAMLGDRRRDEVVARLSEPVRRSPGRHLALWVRLGVTSDGVLQATPAGPQHSHRLRAPAGSTALAVLAPGDDEAPIGTSVRVHALPGAGPW